jgi:cytochrome c-type protein NapC
VLAIHSTQQLLSLVALFAAAVSILIGVWYMVRRPHLHRTTKSLLLLGLGVFPAIVSLTGNISSFEYTLSRPFCGSCHVMSPYLRDAEDPKSQSLAAIHSRNHRFGEDSCYTCHADYQMFGAVTTKMNGMRHLYKYVTEYASTGPDGEGGPPIHLYKPFQSATCRQCHSMTAKKYVEDHGDTIAALQNGDVACIDCHSEIHPLALSRRPKATARAEAIPAAHPEAKKEEKK